MDHMESVRKFEFRECRMPAGFIVDYFSNGETLHGLCIDVSEAGLRAEFDGSVVIGSSGILILRPPKSILKLEAQVAYVKKCQVGLVFIFQTPWERGTTNEFIAMIAKPGTTPRTV